MYRLSRINGRPERNYWRMVYQLSPTERCEVGNDSGRAAACWPGWPASVATISATNHH